MLLYYLLSVLLLSGAVVGVVGGDVGAAVLLLGRVGELAETEDIGITQISTGAHLL